jgi:hypothetical protein
MIREDGPLYDPSQPLDVELGELRKILSHAKKVGAVETTISIRALKVLLKTYEKSEAKTREK